MCVWEGKGKMAEGKKGFSVEWISSLVHWHKLSYTQPVLACVLLSCQCTLRVSRKMIWAVPLLTIFLPWKGSLLSLPCPGHYKQRSEWCWHISFKLEEVKKKSSSTYHIFLHIPILTHIPKIYLTHTPIIYHTHIYPYSCSVDASFFLALMLTDTKTNMKKRNKWNVCASMLVQQPAMSVVESVFYFVIHWNS